MSEARQVRFNATGCTATVAIEFVEPLGNYRNVRVRAEASRTLECPADADWEELDGAIGDELDRLGNICDQNVASQLKKLTGGD